MQNKLEHIRFEAKRVEIEEACEGSFDLHDRFEFHTLLEYSLFGEHFSKMEVLHTKRYKLSWLKETPTEEIIKQIEADKKEAKLHRQKQLDEFLSSIKLPHQYLGKSQILHALKAASSTSTLSYPVIKEASIAADLRFSYPSSASSLKGAR